MRQATNLTPAHSSVKSVNTDGASITQSSDSGNKESWKDRLKIKTN